MLGQARYARIISDLHSRGGCQAAEKDCRNRSLWVNLWVRIFRSECFLCFGMRAFIAISRTLPRSQHLTSVITLFVPQRLHRVNCHRLSHRQIRRQ